MKTHNNKKDIYKWVDGDLKGTRKEIFETHLRTCSSCQQEIESTTKLHRLLKTAEVYIQPSETFEADFWKKIRARQARSEAFWFLRFLQFLKSFDLSIPLPNFAQSFAIVVLAVFIGSTSGILSSKAEWSQTSGKGPLTLSGVNEYKGIPKISLAGSYLAMMELKES